MKTVHKIVALLTRILTEASYRFEFSNPAGRIKRLRSYRPEILPFSIDETNRLISHVAPAYRDYLIVRFFSDMRTSELHGLRHRDVDFRIRRIRVQKAWVRGQPVEPKTPESCRDVFMISLVHDALVRVCKSSEARSELVFPNRDGKPMSANNFARRVWYPLLEMLQLERRRPYQTRHTAATIVAGRRREPGMGSATAGTYNDQDAVPNLLSPP